MTVSPASSSPSYRDLSSTTIQHLTEEYNQKSVELSRTGASDKAMAEFLDVFGKLRALAPRSFTIFYPILTVHLGHFNKALLKSLLEQAKGCDYHLTYVMIVNFLERACADKAAVFFPEPKRREILETLREVYPEDLVLPSLIEPTTSQPPDLSQVGTYLKETLDTLASNEPQTAVRQLIGRTKLLVGYSILHRYLALAWCQYGSFKQAKSTLIRSFSLLEKNNRFSSQATQVALSLLNLRVASNGSEKTPHDLLLAFINMAETEPLDIGLAQRFIDETTTALQSNFDHLPFVYFGIQNIISRLNINRDGFKANYRWLFNSLFELIGITAEICHVMGDIDPWIGENFKKIVSTKNSSFIISLADAKRSPDLFQHPTFAFSNTLLLEDVSTKSIATILTKQIHSLLLTLMHSAINSEGVALSLGIELPVDSTIFTEFLKTGLIHDDGLKQFYISVNYLRTYLDFQAAKRPYPISDDFLNWGKFCVFSLEAPSFLQSKMDQDIQASYYPKSFTEEKFNTFVEEIKARTSFLPDKRTPLAIRLAARDILLASHHLALRSTHQLTFTEKNPSLYSIYNTSKQLFGWRTGESFTEWGERLKKLDPLKLDKKKRVQDILRIFLEFWIRFHQKTEETNAHTSVQKVKPNFDAKKWLSLIKSNTPVKPARVVEERKNGYHHEIEELKELCRRPEDVPSDKFTEIMAAGLLVISEHEKGKTFHGVYMENEEQAIRLCQLLLEVSLDRRVRRALAVAELDKFIVKDPIKLSQCLSLYLEPLIGAFHGPEGRGPLQRHFNMEISSTDTGVIKNRIYF